LPFAFWGSNKASNMTARNAPPVEVPVCNYEEQLILRVPLHIAEDLRKMIREAEDGKKKQFPKRVAFALNCESSSFVQLGSHLF